MSAYLTIQTLQPTRVRLLGPAVTQPPAQLRASPYLLDIDGFNATIEIQDDGLKTRVEPLPNGVFDVFLSGSVCLPCPTTAELDHIAEAIEDPVLESGVLFNLYDGTSLTKAAFEVVQPGTMKLSGLQGQAEDVE